MQQDVIDEIVAIRSIFGDEMVDEIDSTEVKICIPSLESTQCIDLHIFLPELYPSESPPVFELRCDLFDSSTISEMARNLTEMFTPGEVVLYAWIEFLQEEWEKRKPAEEKSADTDIDIAKLKRQKEPPPLPPPINEESVQHIELMRQIAAKIVHGEPLTEKKSTFQAHVFLTTDPSDVPTVIDYLLQNNKIRAATHNIMAYRIESTTREGTFYQDSDDDGESAAGGRLLHLLQMVDARNVVVVVSRWFGGTLLGPARFGLINKAARELLESQGMIRNGGK